MAESWQILGQRFAELAASVEYPLEEIPLNLYPISLPYRAGLPYFEQTVDTTVNSDQFERLEKGKVEQVKTEIPAYYRDYATFVGGTGMIRELEPAAIGGILLKEVMCHRISWAVCIKWKEMKKSKQSHRPWIKQENMPWGVCGGWA